MSLFLLLLLLRDGLVRLLKFVHLPALGLALPANLLPTQVMLNLQQFQAEKERIVHRSGSSGLLWLKAA